MEGVNAYGLPSICSEGDPSYLAACRTCERGVVHLETMTASKVSAVHSDIYLHTYTNVNLVLLMRVHLVDTILEQSSLSFWLFCRGEILVALDQSMVAVEVVHSLAL